MEEAGHLTAQALTGDHTEDSYHPKDAVGAAIKGTMVTATGGAFVSAVQNTLTKQNIGAWGVFTRTGGTIGTFGACGLMLGNEWPDGRQWARANLVLRLQLPWEEPMHSSSLLLRT